MTYDADSWALVTGIAGFMGSHVARQIATTTSTPVIGIDDLSGGAMRNVPPEAEFREGSITDASFVSRLFAQYPIRYVFHLAAYAAEGLSHHIRRFNYTNNLIGSVNLINESVSGNVECFVFTSSIAVYGDVEAPMRESQAPRPIDPYGVAKLAVELDLKAANRYYGLPFVIFRPHNVYGPHQNLGDPYRNVIGIFMNQIMKGQPMTIFGDGSQSRAFSYISDIAPIIASAPFNANARNEIFNIGASTVYSVRELAQYVAKAMGKPDHPIRFLPSREEVHVAHSSHEKIHQTFGTIKETQLSDGLATMADWAKQQGAQQGEAFGQIEVTRNLPPSWAAKRAAAE